MLIYRVNMSTLSYTVEDVPQEWAGIAGRALTSAIVAKEVEPTCHPLGKYNKIAIAPGLLTGTTAPNSGRLSVGSKSPLTGGIKESNAGGTAAQKLAKMNIKAIIIEGIPQEDKYYSVQINKDGIKIEEETELLGKGNYEVMGKLSEKFGKNIAVLSIGQAGENRLTAANISVKDPDGNIRSAGRGGLGAVMGSKKIKYITIDDTGAPGVEIKDPEKFKAAAKFFGKALMEHPVTGQGLGRGKSRPPTPRG
jgi:aldehyde:ferredoxin oxidoreductase